MLRMTAICIPGFVKVFPMYAYIIQPWFGVVVEAAMVSRM